MSPRQINQINKRSCCDVFTPSSGRCGIARHRGNQTTARALLIGELALYIGVTAMRQTYLRSVAALALIVPALATNVMAQDRRDQHGAAPAARAAPPAPAPAPHIAAPAPPPHIAAPVAQPHIAAPVAQPHIAAPVAQPHIAAPTPHIA